MYGDTTVIRGLARTLRDQAGDIRHEADSLVGRADAVHWTGLAADAMRRLARDHAGDLRSCASRHDDAADALDRHAREVDHLVDLIASIERKVHSLLEAAGHLVPHLELPSHGSKGWLDVHLPGL